MYMKYTMLCILSVYLRYTFSIHLMYTFCSSNLEQQKTIQKVYLINSIYLKYTHMLAEYSAKSILFVYISESPFSICQGAAGFWKYTFCIYTSRHGAILYMQWAQKL